MTDQTEAAEVADQDVLALMRTLGPVVEHRRNYGLKIEDAEVYARTVLQSDWLAADRAAARAEGAERVLAAVEARWGDGQAEMLRAARAAATGGGS